MCLILLAHKAHPRYPLIIAANRDERYARATAPAAFWSDESEIYGGRDLEKRGTWLALTRNGRIAAVTNFREGGIEKVSTHSRGELTHDFLRTDINAADYIDGIARKASAYNGFNLIAGSVEELHYFSNRGMRMSPLAAGIHGVSNGLLDAPWPKVERGKRALNELTKVDDSETLIAALLAVLAESTIAPDAALPETGVGIERERMLSSAFLKSEFYGTRASTVVLIDNSGEAHFVERSFGAWGLQGETLACHMNLRHD